MTQPPRKVVNARVPADTERAGDAALTAAGRTKNDAIEALYNALGRRPHEVLDFLDPDWPAPRKPGRPRRADPTPPRD
jgi:hypothetical protein